jgi:hypothetical protein
MMHCFSNHLASSYRPPLCWPEMAKETKRQFYYFDQVDFIGESIGSNYACLPWVFVQDDMQRIEM